MTAGFMEVDCTKAQRSGLRTRPLAATIADTAVWLAQRDNAGAWKDVLRAEAEREILESERCHESGRYRPVPRIRL